MKIKVLQILKFILASILLVSCGSKPLSKIDFSKGDYKLYFITIPGNLSLHETSEFQKKYKNFYINDNTTLEKIKNQIIHERTTGKQSSNSFYGLRLMQGKVLIDGSILDLENNEILYHNGKYKFDINEFERLKDNFKKLNSFEVNCITITNNKAFFEYVKNSNGFINTNSDKKDNPIDNYNGKIDLLTDTSIISIEKDWELLKKEITSDFDNISKIEIVNFLYNGGDSVFITLLCETDFTSKLPEGYKIISKFTDTLNLPLQVYNLEKTEIINFFQTRGISEYELKDLN